VKKSHLATILLLGAAELGAQDATIERAIAAWGRVRSVHATFEQSIVNPITGSTLRSTGTLRQCKPHKLAIEFDQPAGDRIVADGKHVWVYLKSATPGQVMRLSMAQAGAANTDLIGQFLSVPRSSYDAVDAGLDTIAGRAARALVLTARPGASLPFIRAKVWVDTTDALIRQFESVDAQGLSRKVRLLTFTPNARVDSSAFVFRVPQGVRVVGPGA
jgi:outer membrane lipoprotein carrier protein